MPEGTMARVLISMKDEFLELIDEVAENEQRTRSELIREALRMYIRRNVSLQNNRIDQETQSLEVILNQPTVSV
jgi:CopG family transcriptional regulator / antitoxin EndoAI